MQSSERSHGVGTAHPGRSFTPSFDAAVRGSWQSPSVGTGSRSSGAGDVGTSWTRTVSVLVQCAEAMGRRGGRTEDAGETSDHPEPRRSAVASAPAVVRRIPAVAEAGPDGAVVGVVRVVSQYFPKFVCKAPGGTGVLVRRFECCARVDVLRALLPVVDGRLDDVGGVLVAGRPEVVVP